jgi:predicted MPP superfamily phosphohydrolase
LNLVPVDGSTVADSALDLLVISDFHYVRVADHVCPIEVRKSHLGPVLLREALLRLRREGIGPRLVIILGDVVDNGLAAGAERDLECVAAEARAVGVPVLALPGNHDGDYERFVEILGCRPGLHEIHGYGFLLFHDCVAGGDMTTRPPGALEVPGQVACQRPGLPLVALQHNPLYPRIESRYPFMLTNADAILSGYQEAGVILSLSGHYHPGQVAHRVCGMTCYTVPAACESPFRFAHLRLEGLEVTVREHELRHLR